MVACASMGALAKGFWGSYHQHSAPLPHALGFSGRGPNPTRRSTTWATWAFHLFLWVRLVELEGKPPVLNLAPHHETAVRLLGAGRCYLLE
jgi:hypothetical protein